MIIFDGLIRLADRLGKVEDGSPEADRAIHDAVTKFNAERNRDPLASQRIAA